MSPLTELPEKTQTKLLYLRTYLKNLPKSLPTAEKGVVPKYPFGTFRIDRGLVEHTGDEVGAINETFKRIFGWKARTTGDGTLEIQERGDKDIGAVADLLEGFLKKYPDSDGSPNAVLEKWVEDIADGCGKAIQKAGKELPDIPAAISEGYQKRKKQHSGSDSEEEDYMVKRRKLSSIFNNLIVKTKKGGRGRKGKESIARLAIKYVSTVDNSDHYGCIAEKCKWLQDGNAAEDRLLKHATDCKHLALEDRNFALALQAGSSLGAQLASASSTTSIPSSTTSPPTLKPGGLYVDATTTGQKDLQAKMNFCIMKLICVGGLIPNLLDSDEWREFMHVANPKYKVTSASFFTDNLIPKEAANVHNQTLGILRQYNNLTFTFDGNNTRGHESVYTGHFTTPDGQSFLFSGNEDTTKSHDAEWVKNHIFKSVDEVGRARVSNLCSDSTGNTKKGREDAKLEHPIFFALPDCCHPIHLMIGDITKLDDFKSMVTILKATIRYFSHSNSGTKKLEDLRKEENITKGLVSIGKTRFATHYIAAVALERCFPLIRDLVLDKQINIKNQDVVATFTSRHKGTQFQLALAQYIRIVGPLARSLWALEAGKINPGNVFLFWLAMGAELKELFNRDIHETEIEPELAQNITRIFNSRFKQYIEETPDDPYFTVFYLDPRYVRSDVLKKSSPGIISNLPTIRIPGSSAPSDPEAETTPNPKAYRRAKRALKQWLRYEVDFWKKDPSNAAIAPLMAQVKTTKVLTEEFVSQLVTYSRGEYPFADPVGQKSVLEWWTELTLHPKARTLSFLGVKGCSAHANSMADERTGSRFAYQNTPLRNRQTVSTLINMTKVGQWYGIHQKPRKVQTEPTVTFRDTSKDLVITKAKAGTSSGTAIEVDDDMEESDLEMRMIDALDHQDANDDEDRSELFGGWENTGDAFELGDDVNLDSAALKAVLPKEISGRPHTIASFPEVAIGTTQSTSTDDEDVDWSRV